MSQVLLLIDREERRRRSVGIGLSEFSYEVVPARDAAEGLRFARALAPQVVVAVDQAVEGDRPTLEALFEQANRARIPFVLLSTGAVQEGQGEVPDHVLLLSVATFSESEVVERLRVLLLGRQLALDTDFELQSLVGDFTQLPFYALLPRLCEAGISARLESGDGRIELNRGEIWAAASGDARGTKAFCRLAASWSDGLFHLVTAAPAAHEREIDGDTFTLLNLAVEDTLGEVPNRRARVDLNVGKALFETDLTALQREMLAAIGKGTTVGRLLDRLPARDREILRELGALRERGLLEVGEYEPTAIIVLDSSADLPRELLRSHGIQMVPLTIHFGKKSYRDRIDLTPGAFYELLAEGKEHPSTQPPSVRDFAEAYSRLAGRAEVVSIHISAKMSQTVVHAREAVSSLRRSGSVTLNGRPSVAMPDFVVVDGAQVSLPLGLLGLFAARMAARGLSGPEIANRIGGMRSRLHSLFVVDTLEYLVRGGRIGRARALLGQLLRIKPILGVVDGEVAAIDRARGGRAAQLKIVELFKARVAPDRPIILCIAHAAAAAWAERLQALLAAEFRASEVIATEMGPVVGTHAGPGTVGAALFQPESGEEAELISPLSL